MQHIGWLQRQDLAQAEAFWRANLAGFTAPALLANGDGCGVLRASEVPPSFAQERLWLLDRLAPGNPAYHVPLAVRLTGEASPALLARVFAEVARRHEALRTTFEERDGRPVQVVADHPWTA